ncbi:MAG: ABC transporter permease [Blautia sp.]|jgi:ABC-2 type transport system permease protein
MFWNLYTKRLLVSLRDFSVLVWTWIFPLALATLFFFSFSKLDEEDLFTTIPIAVAADGEYEQEPAFSQVLEIVSEGSNPMFVLEKVKTIKEADQLLKDGTIKGYFHIENGTPKLTVSQNGLEQTILKSFLDQYLQQKTLVMRTLEEHPEKLPQLTEALTDRQSYSQEISLSKAKPTSILGYYYALLAMVCMYGGFQGINTVIGLQGNLSPLGARRTLSPRSRLLTVLADLLGGTTIQLLCLVIVVLYIQLVLGVSFGPRLGLVLLTCLAGSLLGVAFGACIGIPRRFSPDAKVGIVVTITMLCSFMAGLMMGGINYTIAKNAPLLAAINPAARITDAFYCLYYYDDLTRYTRNICAILVMALVFALITAFSLRRQRYESI